jgi:hypothetical protein
MVTAIKDSCTLMLCNIRTALVFLHLTCTCIIAQVIICHPPYNASTAKHRFQLNGLVQYIGAQNLDGFHELGVVDTDWISGKDKGNW